MKKILIIIISLITAFSCFSMIACAKKEDATINGVTYKYSEELKGYVVSSYEGSETKILIEEKVNGTKVVEIGKNAFKGNKTIVEVVLPKTIQTINNNAFAICSKLEIINLEEGLTTIGANAFEGCSSIKEISFPLSLATIEIRAFNACGSLKTINYAGPREEFNTANGAFHTGKLEIATTAFDATNVQKIRCSNGEFYGEEVRKMLRKS